MMTEDEEIPGTSFPADASHMLISHSRPATVPVTECWNEEEGRGIRVLHALENVCFATGSQEGGSV